MFKSKDIILVISNLFVFALCVKQISLGLPHTGMLDNLFAFSVNFTVVLMPLGSAAMFYNRFKKHKTNC